MTNRTPVRPRAVRWAKNWFHAAPVSVESAVNVARAATGRQAVVVLGHAYHCRTLLTMSMMAKNVPYKSGFGPFAPEVYRVPSPYPYRWPSGPDRAARAGQIGEHVLPRLRALLGPGSCVGDVRGRGAMLAIELVRPGTTQPAPEVAASVAAACHAEGVLTLVAGTFGNVIRLLPPLVITDELVDDSIDVLVRAIEAVRAVEAA